jgi:magnesium transporter
MATTKKGRNKVLRRRRRAIPHVVQSSYPELVNIDPHAPKSEVLFVAYSEDKIIKKIVTDVHEIEAQIGKWPVIWINVEGLGTKGILEELQRLFHIHPLAMEDIISVHQRAKYESYDEDFFLICHMLEAHEDLITEQVALYVGKNFLLTFQEGPIDATVPVLERLEKGQGRLRRLGPDYLAYAIIDSIIDGYYPMLETFGERLENIEDDILQRPDRRTMSQVHVMKRELLAMRRALFPLREALGVVLRVEPANFSPDTMLHLRDCYDHVVQVTDFIETYRELAADLMDVYLSSISYKLNEVMKVLTIITTICAPPTLIAGIYGMNFNTAKSPLNMPELNWYFGYPFAILLMIISSISMFVVITRTGGLNDQGMLDPHAHPDKPDDNSNSHDSATAAHPTNTGTPSAASFDTTTGQHRKLSNVADSVARSNSKNASNEKTQAHEKSQAKTQHDKSQDK